MDEPRRIERLPPAPPRPDDAHKGTFGTVIVVGGSATMIGAPAICARAAFRAGAGLVKIATSPDVLPHAIVIEPSATGVRLAEDPESSLQAIGAADPDGEAVLAIGPGIGQIESAGALVRSLLRGPRRVVLDADGLNLLAASGETRPDGPPAVLTPHPGEFRRLAKPLGIDASPTNPAERPAAATAMARAHRAVVVLKGRHTIVTDGERLFLNATGNPALATAGSGDVLTGLVAALIAQGVGPFDAAILGVHVHGLAADRWAEAHGSAGLLARELADLLPDVLEMYRLQGG